MGVNFKKVHVRVFFVIASLLGNVSMGGTVDKFIGTPVKSLSGPVFDWAKVKGKVIMVVNIATRCGYTPQLKGLQKLYDEFHAQGFAVVGIPSNDFGGQTPEAPLEVGKICALNFGVNFPLTEKLVVKGPGKHPLVANLLAASPQKNEISWNFEKFLINRKGIVVARFPSETEPSATEISDKIKSLLKEAP